MVRLALDDLPRVGGGQAVLAVLLADCLDKLRFGNVCVFRTHACFLCLFSPPQVLVAQACKIPVFVFAVVGVFRNTSTPVVLDVVVSISSVLPEARSLYTRQRIPYTDVIALVSYLLTPP